MSSSVLASILGWFDSTLGVLLEKIYNVFIDLIQILIDMIPTFLLAVVQLIGTVCPPPPVTLTATGSSIASGVSALLEQVIMVISWLLPMQFMVYLVHAIICCLSAYFACVVLLRWAKVLT